MVFRFRPHVPANNKDSSTLQPSGPVIPSAIITQNIDIIQAKADRYGVLQRPDGFTGENNNEIITLKPAKERKKDTNENKEKYLPGERLLYSIKKEKPEYLKPEMKNLSTKKKDKLKSILEKLN